LIPFRCCCGSGCGPKCCCASPSQKAHKCTVAEAVFAEVLARNQSPV
jgi:hypothetical protein